jgi:hypothetical protein
LLNLAGMSDGPGQLVNIGTPLTTLFGKTTPGEPASALGQIWWD